MWDTVASRSIPIRLQRASPDELEKLTRIRGHLINGICLPFRRKLRRFADDTWSALREIDPVTPRELGARQCDVWRPLLAIAEVTGARWSVTARAAARAIHGAAEEDGDAGLRLLDDVRSLFQEKKNPPSLHTQVILQTLIARDDRSWSEYGKKGALTPRDVGLLLGHFGVKSTTVRVGGVIAKGYHLADLRPVFDRYMRPPGLSVTSVTEGGVTDVTEKKGTHTLSALDHPGEPSAPETEPKEPRESPLLNEQPARILSGPSGDAVLSEANGDVDASSAAIAA